MDWFCAFVVRYIEYLDPVVDAIQEDILVEEVVFLVRASCAEEAWEKAEKSGRQTPDSEGQTDSDGNPSAVRFGGVRRVLALRDPFNPEDLDEGGVSEFGIEIGYSVYSIPDREALRKLVNNESTVVIYEPDYPQE